MGGKKLHELVKRQYGVVTRGQLSNLGFGRHAVAHRIERGRLFPVHAGVYAVGRPQLTREGRWMAAVLSCGPEAVLSHESAAVLWRIRGRERRGIEVTSAPHRRRAGITAHRRHLLAVGDATRRDGIPVTTPASTLIDLAGRLPRGELEAAINEADKLGLIHPEQLLSALDTWGGRRGAKTLRKLLSRHAFTPTDSDLERRFLPLVRRTGLPRPRTRARVNGFKVDFYWPELGLVVETDGLRYHRTPSEQAKDRLRDQTHTAAGLTCLRFTWVQVTEEPAHVEATLSAVARRVTLQR